MDKQKIIINVDGVDQEFFIHFRVTDKNTGLVLIYLSPKSNMDDLICFKIVNDEFQFLDDKEEEIANEIYEKYQEEHEE